MIGRGVDPRERLLQGGGASGAPVVEPASPRPDARCVFTCCGLAFFIGMAVSGGGIVSLVALYNTFPSCTVTEMRQAASYLANEYAGVRCPAYNASAPVPPALPPAPGPAWGAAAPWGAHVADSAPGNATWFPDFYPQPVATPGCACCNWR